jgi:squalene-hopene/tetraprenyl-beta-curcumene cyclase
VGRALLPGRPTRRRRVGRRLDVERIPVTEARTVSSQDLRAAGKGVRHEAPPLPPFQYGIERARRHLLALQAPDGHWVGELQGDTILESEYVLLMAFLGRERDAHVAKAARYILAQQLPDGGWNNYPDGPAELSVSVKAYCALKLAGQDADAPHMRRACDLIRRLGGAADCNSFTKFYLALLGQFPYHNCPAVPPEMMLLPRWAYLSIYAMSSWTRTIVVPLSIFYAHKPVRRLPPELGIAELFLAPPDTPLWPHPPTRSWFTWTNFFLGLDQLFKRVEGWLGPLRRVALRRAVAWMKQHFADSDGLGAIFPPMIYTVICLKCLGEPDDSPEMRWALRQLEDLMIEEGDTLRLQPCFSPVWDTALTLKALADAGVTGSHPASVRGVRWLLDREVRRPGDWSVSNPRVEPGGWFFEYHNGFYPDTDDTAMVLMALAKSGHAERAEARPAVRRAVRWLLAMQNRDGGWAAFDRNINKQILTRVPFADHNAMLDPSCPDITARVLEALGHFGFRAGQRQVDRALAFLERTQEPDGCWLGRWGVNYIYGTWQVLEGLARVDHDLRAPMVRRAVAWLKQAQQADGAWGETCRSYDDPSLAGQGHPTASQTAWALLGLLAAGEADSPAVRAGIDWLLRTQRPDGSWHEDHFTGTGFPKVFYLKYHMYRLYFPLMALARFGRDQVVRTKDKNHAFSPHADHVHGGLHRA